MQWCRLTRKFRLNSTTPSSRPKTPPSSPPKDTPSCPPPYVPSPPPPLLSRSHSLSQHPLVLTRPTLLYIPHGPRTLFDSLLRSNWTSPEQLEKVVVWGNRLDLYDDPTYSGSLVGRGKKGKGGKGEEGGDELGESAEFVVRAGSSPPSLLALAFADASVSQPNSSTITPSPIQKTTSKRSTTLRYSGSCRNGYEISLRRFGCLRRGKRSGIRREEMWMGWKRRLESLRLSRLSAKRCR